MALWFFNKVVWLVLAAMSGSNAGYHVEGRPKLLFAYILLNIWSVMLRCAGNVTTSSFQQFPGSWSAKFLFTEKEVIRNFKNHILVTWYTDLPILRKPNHYYLFKIWPTNRFRRQNHLTFIFIYTWPLSANGLFLLISCNSTDFERFTITQNSKITIFFGR